MYYLIVCKSIDNIIIICIKYLIIQMDYEFGYFNFYLKFTDKACCAMISILIKKLDLSLIKYFIFILIIRKYFIFNVRFTV